MGKRNQQRRAEKKRHHRHRVRVTPPPRRQSTEDDDRAFAEDLAWTGATTTDPEVRDKVVEWLAEGPPRQSGAALVDAVVATCFTQILAAVFAHGWDTHDLRRAADRRLSAEAMTVVDRALGHGPIVGQDVDRRTAIANALTALGFLATLPPLPDLAQGQARPADTGRRDTTDTRMLERVRALLAKAESTTFQEEADALTAKAQQLMARHAIDAAMLDANGPADGVESRKVWIDRPYEAEKVQLLAAVASANRARSVWIKEIGMVVVIGFAADLSIVDMLFTSLLVQATRAMTTVPPRGDGRTRAFRSSFLVGYGGRIGERLREATADATREAATDHGDALLPVLADRADAVDQATATAFPHLEPVGGRAHHHAGYLAGRAAADLATLDAGPAVDRGA